jgi:AraC family transcriptional regulator
MRLDEPYDTPLRDYFRLTSPALAVRRTLRKSKFVIPDGELEASNWGCKTPMPSESAFILSLQRNDCTSHALWLGGRSVLVVPFPFGMVSLVNLALDPTPYPGSTQEGLSFYLRRDTFDRLADDLGGNRIDDLAIRPGVAINDSVIANLGLCLLPTIERPEQLSTLFVDHVVMALHTHLAQRYGGMRMPRTSGCGSLTPWQLRLARDMIDAHLTRRVSLAKIASNCGLSVSHFARAFTCSTGVPPHRWLMQRRVDRAKDLMRTTSTPLAAVAVACGFSDQSHFTRVFAQTIGVTPNEWRRVKAK